MCARESLQTHIAGFVDFLLLCLWSTIAFTMHAVSKERIVQTQNFVFGRFSNFFFYPNETWTHPPTSNFFLDFWNFFIFAKPLRTTPLTSWPSTSTDVRFRRNRSNQTLRLAATFEATSTCFPPPVNKHRTKGTICRAMTLVKATPSSASI